MAEKVKEAINVFSSSEFKITATHLDKPIPRLEMKLNEVHIDLTFKNGLAVEYNRSIKEWTANPELRKLMLLLRKIFESVPFPFPKAHKISDVSCIFFLQNRGAIKSYENIINEQNDTTTINSTYQVQRPGEIDNQQFVQENFQCNPFLVEDYFKFIAQFDYRKFAMNTFSGEAVSRKSLR